MWCTVRGESRALAFHEASRWSPGELLSFEGLLQENVRRSATPELTSFDGSVWHEPLPLELARQREPLVRLLEAALEAAGIDTHRSAAPITARVLLAPKAALVIVVNETPSDATRTVHVDGAVFDIPVRAYRARLVLIERSSGKILVTTPGHGVRGL